MVKVYPVIFTVTKNEVLIEVPDLQILSEGKDLEDAILMARDAIGAKSITFEDAGIKIPSPSTISDIDVSKGTFASEGEGFISMVDVDFVEYRRKHDNKTVRRNVTLPNWLNMEAEKAQINVSRILQEALMEKLNVSR